MLGGGDAGARQLFGRISVVPAGHSSPGLICVPPRNPAGARGGVAGGCWAESHVGDAEMAREIPNDTANVERERRTGQTPEVGNETGTNMTLIPDLRQSDGAYFESGGVCGTSSCCCGPTSAPGVTGSDGWRSKPKICARRIAVAMALDC